ncbi:hypothetical protein [Saliphagus sp. LR7]|uniref:DUF7529 family protein n=1 Tax=Saliphagus sp. LR7 TaxID=2282654 RepID=UPI000DF7ECE3|nr:hypothetical protein [Saliphagus sp. LR7]
MTGDSPTEGLGPEVWPTFLADAADIAAEYREAGWEVVECDPGDVTAVASTDHDRFGFSVLVADDEYEAIEELFDRAEFDSVEVFSHAVEGVVFVLAVERDEEREVAVTVPIFYRRAGSQDLFEVAEDRGELPIHLRTPSGDRWLTFSHDEPSLFAGDAESGESGG